MDKIQGGFMIAMCSGCYGSHDVPWFPGLEIGQPSSSNHPRPAFDHVRVL